MKVSIFIDKDFQYDKCKKLFEASNSTLQEECDFDYLIDHFQFFQYTTDDNRLIGCIYFYYKNNDLHIATFANNGFAKEKTKCLKEALSYFNCDIYAETHQRHVRLVLLKSGFKKISNNTYIYKREQK